MLPATNPRCRPEFTVQASRNTGGQKTRKQSCNNNQEVEEEGFRVALQLFGLYGNLRDQALFTVSFTLTYEYVYMGDVLLQFVDVTP